MNSIVLFVNKRYNSTVILTNITSCPLCILFMNIRVMLFAFIQQTCYSAFRS